MTIPDSAARGRGRPIRRAWCTVDTSREHRRGRITPRLPDGTVDLGGHGIWNQSWITDFGKQLVGIKEIPFLPWTKAMYEYNKSNQVAYDPQGFCLPPGGPRMFGTPYPSQFLQQADRQPGAAGERALHPGEDRLEAVPAAAQHHRDVGGRLLPPGTAAGLIGVLHKQSLSHTGVRARKIGLPSSGFPIPQPSRMISRTRRRPPHAYPGSSVAAVMAAG